MNFNAIPHWVQLVSGGLTLGAVVMAVLGLVFERDPKNMKFFPHAIAFALMALAFPLLFAK